jgi:phage baseplate assembly protein W
MAKTGFTGIAFPFRFSGRGGVAVSTTSADDFSHIKEGLMQVIGTAINERIFELGVGSEVYKAQFNNAWDESDIAILKFYVQDAVKKWDNRVEVDNITVTPMDDEVQGTHIHVEVDFTVKKYMKSDTVSIKVEE